VACFASSMWLSTMSIFLCECAWSTRVYSRAQ
jgi:hypothetical protein